MFLALALGTVGTLTLLALHVAPAANGLGLLPSTVTRLQASGLTLQIPTGRAAITARQAAAAVTATQSGSVVKSEVLATVVGPRRTRLGPPGQLCWVVFLNPGSQVLGNLQAPSDVDLDAVLVDARSGAVIEGFLSFDSSSRGLQVGSE